MDVVARPSFSTIQSAVALVAGLSSIGGAAYSAMTHLRPAQGELVAIVRDARTGAPVPSALVEVLTPDDAIVTQLGDDDGGLARRSLAAGGYRLRVTHPRFAPQTRDVRVQPGETAEVPIQLTRLEKSEYVSAAPSGSAQIRGGSPVDRTTQAVGRGVAATRRFFGRLGF